MGNYASSGLFFMSITGHKYRQFREGRNMTRTQLGWLSCRQKKDPEKGWELVHFCLTCFQEESVSASLISTPHWVMLPYSLYITSSLSISSFLVSISQLSHCIVAPSFSPSHIHYIPVFPTVFIHRTDLSHEDSFPCQPLYYITSRTLSPPGAVTHWKQWEQWSPRSISLAWRWDTGERKESSFPLLSYLTDIASIASREKNYCELPMLTVQDLSLNRLQCLH